MPSEKFFAARAAEQRQRDLIHLGAIAWLPLRRGNHVFASVPLKPYTLRHELEFFLAGNGFVTRRDIQRADVFLFLWRLHPFYCAPRFGREAYVARLAKSHAKLLRLWLAFGSLRSAITHRRLTGLLRRCDYPAVVRSIRGFLDLVEQDAPGEPSDTGGRPHRHATRAPGHQRSDNWADWLMSTYGMTYEAALDIPIALVHQLHRERMLQLPDGELMVFSPSDLIE